MDLALSQFQRDSVAISWFGNGTTIKKGTSKLHSSYRMKIIQMPYNRRGRTLHCRYCWNNPTIWPLNLMPTIPSRWLGMSLLPTWLLMRDCTEEVENQFRVGYLNPPLVAGSHHPPPSKNRWKHRHQPRLRERLPTSPNAPRAHAGPWDPPQKHSKLQGLRFQQTTALYLKSSVVC